MSKKMAAVVVMVVCLFTGVMPVQAAVVSGLDTAEESFFSSSGTSSDMNSSEDTFISNENSNSNTQQTPNASVSDSVQTAVTPNTTETINSNNTYNYYYVPTPTVTTPVTDSENITLNGTTVKTDDSKETVQTTKISLKKPAIATVVAKKGAALVVLNRAVSGADGYQIQICKKSGFKKSQKLTQLRTVLTAKKVAVNTSGKHYVRVRAYKVVNGKNVYSAWSKVKTVTIK